ncbi:MAG: sulfatase [Verrucomicrobiota bacterium]
MKPRLLVCCLFLQLGLGAMCFATERPNVLFISVDDLNDWTGFAGNEQVISPNMDRLAQEGVWFSKAFCQYPVCAPSRASVMSGVYFHQLQSEKTGVKDEFVAEKIQSMGSDLLHGYFKEHGYKTMAVGKILHDHLPPDDLDMSGGRGGWGVYRDENGDRRKLNWMSDKTLTDWGYEEKPEDEMSDSKAANWAVARLEENHEEPFFLMVGFLRPHVPWYVPRKYFELYDREQLSLPPYRENDLDDIPQAGLGQFNKGYPRTEWAVKNDQWRHLIQAYFASITFVDTKIGQVLEALDQSPHRENTIVVLWSDHGYHMGEKTIFQKDTLWERSAAVPLIIKLPAPMEAQTDKGRCDRVVGLIDLYPTLVDLCGLPANDRVSGRSLRPLLADRDTKWDYPALTYRKNGSRSAQDHRYRYIEYGDGTMELYDHKRDPHEWDNVAEDSQYSDILKRLKSKLSRWHVGQNSDVSGLGNVPINSGNPPN